MPPVPPKLMEIRKILRLSIFSNRINLYEINLIDCLTTQILDFLGDVLMYHCFGLLVMVLGRLHLYW